MWFGENMSKSRRQFLNTSLGLMGAAAACSKKPTQPAELPPGAPPAFGTAPPVGPEVSASTFAEAGKLVQFEMSAADQTQAALSWRSAIAPLYEMRKGPHKVAIEATVAPWSRCDPVGPGQSAGPEQNRFVRTKSDAAPLPASDDEIAHSPLTRLSRWIEERKLSSERLTNLYLERLTRFDPKLRCVITLTRDAALAQAKQADAEIAAGKYRGPLHGIPWGAKDLVDTAGIATTYGAEPFKDRVPKEDAAGVERLRATGARAGAKVLCGAL